VVPRDRAKRQMPQNGGRGLDRTTGMDGKDKRRGKTCICEAGYG
jgi:hypothetical protein